LNIYFSIEYYLWVRSISRERVPRVRRLTDSLISLVLIAISSYVFMTTVPFLPGAPVIPLIISLLLGVTAYRLPGYSDTFLALIVFFSIAWQFLLFILPPSPSEAGVEWQAVWFSVAFVLAILALNMLSAIFEPLAVSSAALASALLLTRYFYIAPALLAVPLLVRGVGSMIPTAYSFIATSLPLIVLENALRGDRGLPILFSYLGDLRDNIREPIPSLNIFAVGISSMISDRWRDVVQYFSSGAVLGLVVPLLCLSISFVLAAIATRYALRLYERIPQLENRELVRRALRPIVVSITSVGVFSLLLVSLSPSNIGGYLTGFQENPGLLEQLFLWSLAIGLVFSVKEAVLYSLEGSEEAREALKEAISEGEKGFSSLSSMVRLVSTKAPSIDLSEEVRELEEVKAALRDAAARLPIAKRQLVEEALKRVRGSYLPRIREMPGRIRGKVVEEILRLDTACKKCNYTLRSAGVKGPLLPEVSEVPRTEDLEQVLSYYEEYVSKVRASTSSLYSLYIKSVESINKLFSSEIASLPPEHMNPASLLNSGNYPEAVELVAGLWRSLQESVGPKLATACPEIVEAASRLESVLRGEDLGRLRAIISSIGDACRGVGGAVDLVRAVEELRALLISAVDAAMRDLERVRRVEALLEKLDPAASRGLELRSPRMAGELLRVRRDLEGGEASLPRIVSLSIAVRDVLWSYTVSAREDESKILILSQYPLARAIIDGYIKSRGEVNIEELPFTPSASEVYARIYSRSSRNVVYREEEAVIRVAEV